MSGIDFDKMGEAIAASITPEAIEQGHKNWIREEKENPNNFSFWFKEVLNGIGPKRFNKDFIIPFSVVIDCPEKLLGRFTCEEPGDYEEIIDWIVKDVYPVVKDKFPEGQCFVKNGCFSNKFNFNASCFLQEISVVEIFKKLREISCGAMMLETGGDLEFVFRRFIEAKNPYGHIYNGMPVRPETRVFYDFETKKVLYSANYWDWNYCSEYWNDEDFAVMEKCKDKLNSFFELTKTALEEKVAKNFKYVKLKGQWSIDFMAEGGMWYMIDMAIAQRSAYWDENKIKN